MQDSDLNDPSVTDETVVSTWVDVEFFLALSDLHVASGEAPSVEDSAALVDSDLSWVTTDTAEWVTAYRLREGIERFLITDINNPGAASSTQSAIPVQHDTLDTDPRAFNHLPGGINVLYMDGHVRFLQYATAFPATRAWAAMLGAGLGFYGDEDDEYYDDEDEA